MDQQSAPPQPPPPSGCFSPCRFIKQVLVGRWFMMFASFLIMAGAGATYLFGVYSKVIKSTLGYDQSTLNLLGSFKDLGANVGVLSGLMAEVTPTWFVLLVGSAMNFAGYFMIWLAVTKKISKPSVWQMCIYICMGANSQNFANTGSLVTCVKNFPESRGMLIGLMKGFIGLSGAVFTQLYLAIYGNDAESLILLIGWLPAVISILFVFNIKTMKISRHPNEVKVFYEYLIISVGLALCLMGLTIAQKYVDFSHVGHIVSATAVCFLLFLPCLIAFREEFTTLRLKEQAARAGRSRVVVVEEEPPLVSSKPEPEIVEVTGGLKGEDHGKKDACCCTNICNKPKRGEDYSILQALLSIDMLILFVATFCGLGCSLTAVDNLGQIGESLGYPQRTISTFVSLVSIWNYFGRVFSGFVSEKLLLKWKIPRTLMMTFALLLPSIGDLLIAIPFPGSVYIASLLIGFSYGVQLTLLFIIISELFGLKYYSTLFNCGQLASPLGSYILNVRIVGKLYDREALKQLSRRGMTRSMVRELTCIGKDCYRRSFLILAGVNLFGALVSLILVVRTRQYYKTDIYKRFRDEMEANEKEMMMMKTIDCDSDKKQSS
ncbi:protein NUCLEAR FUSION DEFECTIVE 4-like [Sesamum indicum]|uniref:Protein NUCLEAR FUSION DEFECTIVE 4-like n=1 Tax=Sesamum indicum TaxID=4182 RepID=A0A6I9TGD2_SESIN|nr:protein NUCLEAR FUSION DEFECTIVE 4-like [Sesamum indicum]